MNDFADVLTAAQEGSTEALDLLWRDYHPSLLRYLRTTEPGAAEDLASDVWLLATQNLGRFRGGEPHFRAWLFTIARRRVIDHHRRATRRRTTPVSWIPDCPAPDDPAATALDTVSLGDLGPHLRSLPPDQAEAVLLRIVAGLDVARVAGIMGKRPGAVRVLSHRGLRTLAQRLNAAARVPELVA